MVCCSPLMSVWREKGFGLVLWGGAFGGRSGSSPKSGRAWALNGAFCTCECISRIIKLLQGMPFHNRWLQLALVEHKQQVHVYTDGIGGSSPLGKTPTQYLYANFILLYTRSQPIANLSDYKCIIQCTFSLRSIISTNVSLVGLFLSRSSKLKGCVSTRLWGSWGWKYLSILGMGVGLMTWLSLSSSSWSSSVWRRLRFRARAGDSGSVIGAFIFGGSPYKVNVNSMVKATWKWQFKLVPYHCT